MILFQYKCKVDGCQFRTRRTRLYQHYTNTHKMSNVDAEKMVPARLISTSDTQRMNCPLCEHRCLPIMLRKHLFRAHNKDLTLEDINMVFEEAIKCKANNDRAAKAATTAKTKSDEVLRLIPELQCHKCQDVPGPVGDQMNRYSCIDESHILCEKDKNRCSCGSEVGKKPSPIIAKLLEGLPWICKHYKNGCREVKIEVNDLELHQMNCVFRKVYGPWVGA